MDARVWILPLYTYTQSYQVGIHICLSVYEYDEMMTVEKTVTVGWGLAPAEIIGRNPKIPEKKINRPTTTSERKKDTYLIIHNPELFLIILTAFTIQSIHSSTYTATYYIQQQQCECMFVFRNTQTGFFR